MSSKGLPPSILVYPGQNDAPPPRLPRVRRCESCGSELVALPKKSKRHVQRYTCPACELYNAAVHAIDAAARRLAEQRYPGAKLGRCWVNEYGFFAHVNGICERVGSEKEAAPFAALTSLALAAVRL